MISLGKPWTSKAPLRDWAIYLSGANAYRSLGAADVDFLSFAATDGERWWVATDLDSVAGIGAYRRRPMEKRS